MALDLIARTARQFTHHVAHHAVAQVLDAAAGRAHHVMVMPSAAAEAVVEAAVVQEHAADGAGLGQELHRAENGGAAHTGYLAEDIVYAEVAALVEDGRHHGQPRRRQTVALVLQSLE
jgi:hypothetical protein